MQKKFIQIIIKIMIKYLLILLIVNLTLQRNLQIISIDSQLSNSTALNLKKQKITNLQLISQNKIKQKENNDQQVKKNKTQILTTPSVPKKQQASKSQINTTLLSNFSIRSNDTGIKGDNNVRVNSTQRQIQNSQAVNIPNMTTIRVPEFRPTFTVVPPKIISIQKLQAKRNRSGDQGLDIKLISPQLRDSPGFRKIFAKNQSLVINPQLLKLKEIKRTLNGSNNNEENKKLGMVNTSQARFCPAQFENQRFQPVTNRPNPREISNVVGRIRQNVQLSKHNITLAFVVWGQFVDHDIQITPGNNGQSINIPIPRCDDFFDRDCNGSRVIPFTRALISNQSDKRVPINGITTWMDASMIYGSSDEQAKKLRKFVNGELKIDKFKFNLLPEGQPVINQFQNKTLQTMEGGDVRSNQNLILLSYQTLFLRQHNRICDILTRNKLKLSDQEIYTIAKNYVTGLIQKITYDEFLPILLGKQGYKKFIGEYPGYDKTIDPTIQLQFSGAAYRFGHSQVVPRFPQVDFEGFKVKMVAMDDALFRPELMSSSSLERILRGATRTFGKQRDGQFVNQIRNLLVLAPQLRHVRMDLLAINIHRGRQLGIPHYNAFRECFGLKRIQDFNQISPQQSKNAQLKQVYKQIDKIDAYVGIQAEKSIEDSILGQTSIIVIGETFKKLRNGDRFWYQLVFPNEIIKQIKNTKLSDVILRNTGMKQIQQDVFHYNFPQQQQ